MELGNQKPGVMSLLQKKLLHAEFLMKLAGESSKEKTGNTVDLEKSESENLHHLKGVSSTWCENSVLVDPIKSCILSI